MPLFLSDIEPLSISTLPSNLTTPEPLGVIAMFLFEADTIALVSTSKSPPRLGVLSSETFDKPAPKQQLI